MYKKVLFIITITLSINLWCQKLNFIEPDSVGLEKNKLEKIEVVVNKAISLGNIPGAVVCVVRYDKIAYLKSFGYKELLPLKIKMKTDGIFDLASLSKCVGTTMCIMKLVENGQLRLSDPVKLYFPDFKPWVDEKTGEKTSITIRDLLTHSSGLSPYVNVNQYIKTYGKNTPKQLMKYISTEVKRNFKPGSKFMYSCLNFITLQNILEKISGERLCDYAKKNIFEPLEMYDTQYFPLDRDIPKSLYKRCVPTEIQSDGLPLIGSVHDPIARLINNGNSGNAGVFSTAEDLAILASYIMMGNKNGVKSILGNLTIETMTQVPNDNNSSIGRALGWDKYSSYSGFMGDIFDRETTIGHTGYTGTSMLMDLKTKTAVIILTNRVHPYDKGAVGRLRAEIANVVAGAINYNIDYSLDYHNIKKI